MIKCDYLPLGKVIDLILCKDGIIRLANLKASKGIFTINPKNFFIQGFRKYALYPKRTPYSKACDEFLTKIHFSMLVRPVKLFSVY